jgi:hypothetical protein
VPSQYSSDNTVQQLTKAFYKQASIFWEESTATEMVCYVSEAWEEEEHYWSDACHIQLCVECFHDYQIKLNL